MRPPAQKAAETAGLALGILVGAGAAGGLLAYWAATRQEVSLLTEALAFFLGAGFFLIVWIGLTSWIAPLFSAADTKAARGMVRLTKYWVHDCLLGLEISNELAANHFVAANQAVLLGLKTYRLSSGLLCHDVRLNTHIQTTVHFDRPPTEDEALHLLWPTGEAEVTRNFCEDCPFDLLGITIEEIST